MADLLAPASRLGTLWGNRRVLRLLVARDLKVKYADSVLGYFWSLLEPLLMAGIYWFIFTVLIGRPFGAEPYIVFLLLAMLPWQWTNTTLRTSMRAFNKDAKLVRSTNLPREIWVLRTVLSRFSEFVLSLPVLALFAVLNSAELHWQVVFFPVAVLVQGLLLTGLGLMLAPLAVLSADIERLVRILLRLMFYLSPVIYGAADVQRRLGETAADIYLLNPLAGIFDLYRTAFFPDLWAGWQPLAVSVVAAVGAMVVGVLVFRRFEGTVLKEI